MSYDLQIWSAEPVALPPSAEGWSSEGSAWLQTGRGWHITIWNSTAAESEDAPDEIAVAIPGIAWFTELSLHPFDASPRAVSDFTKLARKLAKPVRGAVFDPQTDKAHIPPGKSRFVAPAKESPAECITMSWWFDRHVLPSPLGFRRLLDIFETLLPEALPRRYGTSEPPEFRYEAGGRPALERFLNEEIDNYIIWYPHPPVIGMELLLPRNWGAFRDGFRTNHLSVAMDAAVLAQPGWERQLNKFWRAMSIFLLPFYGDVRTIGGYRRAGGQLHSHPSTTENHPVRSWFWAGLPPTVGHAAVIGDPYLALWPGLAEIAEYDGGLAFLGSPRIGQAEAERLAVGIPREIADPQPQSLHNSPGSAVLRLDRPFPKLWPFAAPFDPSRQ